MDTPLITHKERLTPLVRVVLFAAGCFCFYAPYDLLIRPDWQDRWNFVFLFFLVIAAGAVLVGLFFIFAAVAAYNVRVSIDRQRRAVRVVRAIPYCFLQRSRYSFPDIVSVHKEVVDWDSGPSTWRVLLTPRAGKPFVAGEFADERAADERVAVLKEWLELG